MALAVSFHRPYEGKRAPGVPTGADKLAPLTSSFETMAEGAVDEELLARFSGTGSEDLS